MSNQYLINYMIYMSYESYLLQIINLSPDHF